MDGSLNIDYIRENKEYLSVGSFCTQEETDLYKKIVHLKKESPIPDSECLANLGLFLQEHHLLECYLCIIYT